MYSVKGCFFLNCFFDEAVVYTTKGELMAGVV